MNKVILILALLAGVAMTVAVHDHRALVAAQAQARKDAEAAKAREQGLVVAAQASKADLDKARAAFAADLDAIGKTGAKVHVERVDHLVGYPVTVKAPAGKPCVLADGDSVRVDVEALELRSEAGNLFLAGHWALSKALGGDDYDLLASGDFKAAAGTRVEEASAPPRPGWRPEWGISFGPTWSVPREAPTGGWLAIDRHVLGSLWVTARATADVKAGPLLAAGLRWEW